MYKTRLKYHYPIASLIFGLLVFLGLRLSLVLKAESTLSSGLSLVETQITAQGLILDSAGISHLITKLVEKDSIFYLHNLIVTPQGGQTYESNRGTLFAWLPQALQLIHVEKDGFIHVNAKLSLTDRAWTWMGIVTVGAIFLFFLALYFLHWIYIKSMEREILVKKLEIARQVSHDIRSPIALLTMIAERSDTSEPEAKKHIRFAVSRIREICENLLESPTRLRDAGRITQDEFRMLIDQKTAQIGRHKEIAFDFDFQVKEIKVPNANDLKRVFSNLLDNAVDAILQSGRIEIRSAQSGEQVQLTLLDTGIGIPPEVLRQLGKRGFSYGKLNGSGLGLSYAFEVIRAWGGEIDIQSEVGKGTSVKIKIPLA